MWMCETPSLMLSFVATLVPISGSPRPGVTLGSNSHAPVQPRPPPVVDATHIPRNPLSNESSAFGNGRVQSVLREETDVPDLRCVISRSPRPSTL